MPEVCIAYKKLNGRYAGSPVVGLNKKEVEEIPERWAKDTKGLGRPRFGKAGIRFSLVVEK